MPTNRYIQYICQAIVRLLFVAMRFDVIFDTIEPAFIVSRIQLGIVEFATFMTNTPGTEINKVVFNSPS